MITPSVISSPRQAGASPESPGSPAARSNRSAWKNCLLDRLTLSSSAALSGCCAAARGSGGRPRAARSGRWDDQPRLLGHGEELVGRQQAAARVVPAHQGLEARDLAAREVHERLVVDPELPRSIARRRSVSSCRRAMTMRCMLRSKTSGGPPRGLGAVHGGVGVAQQVLRPLVLRGVDGDADAGGDEDLVAAEVDRRRELLVDALGDPDGVADVAPLVEQDGELVAADRATVSDGRRAASRAPEICDQQLVAHQMAEAVVDDLEAVEVEEEDGGRCVRPRRERSIDWRRRSMNSARLGRPVSASWKASWRSCSSAACGR